MYNGIGLLTPRGSGTSGYVQGNKFNLRGPPQVRTEPPKDGGPKQKQPNQEILDHKKKREVELKVEQERERLEQDGVHSEAEIEELLGLFRAQELAKIWADVSTASVKLADETHAVAQRKLEQMSKLKAAFGVKDDVQEGDAFNRELQEQLKAKRIAEREAAQIAREEEAKRREKEARRMEKEKAKEAKQREKEAKQREEEREAARQAEEDRWRNASPEARLYRKYEAAPERYDPYADERGLHHGAWNPYIGDRERYADERSRYQNEHGRHPSERDRFANERRYGRARGDELAERNRSGRDMAQPAVRVPVGRNGSAEGDQRRGRSEAETRDDKSTRRRRRRSPSASSSSTSGSDSDSGSESLSTSSGSSSSSSGSGTDSDSSGSSSSDTTSSSSGLEDANRRVRGDKGIGPRDLQKGSPLEAAVPKRQHTDDLPRGMAPPLYPSTGGGARSRGSDGNGASGIGERRRDDKAGPRSGALDRSKDAQTRRRQHEDDDKDGGDDRGAGRNVKPRRAEDHEIDRRPTAKTPAGEDFDKRDSSARSGDRDREIGLRAKEQGRGVSIREVDHVERRGQEQSYQRNERHVGERSRDQDVDRQQQQRGREKERDAVQERARDRELETGSEKEQRGGRWGDGKDDGSGIKHRHQKSSGASERERGDVGRGGRVQLDDHRRGEYDRGRERGRGREDDRRSREDRRDGTLDGRSKGDGDKVQRGRGGSLDGRRGASPRHGAPARADRIGGGRRRSPSTSSGSSHSSGSRSNSSGSTSSDGSSGSGSSSSSGTSSDSFSSDSR